MVFKTIREKNAAPKLVLIGNFGAGNIGDELILAGFLKKISRELPKAKVTVLAGEPKLVRRFHGVDALPHIPTGVKSFFRGAWWRSLKKIRESDAVIFPGGGLFSDEESPQAVWIWGAHILLARYFWRPVFLLGQSIGPFRATWAQNFTRFCLKKTEWIGVRDLASESELKRIGVASKKIKLSRDSSFWLVNRLPKVKKTKLSGRIKILVSVRNFPRIDPRFWGQLARTLDAITDKFHARIFFAEFGGGDREAWKKIRRKAKHASSWKVLELPESAEGILKEIKKNNLVIGMRLHSLIAAQITGVPAIGLAYSRKVEAFAENIISVSGFKKEQLLKILH
ncbi:MAG: polysaccharide pyruvyl transferase family protein [Candidatus Peribacteraceae bacterium]|nr:polysaccharide pyruvyl transferase family protein [Candidatus Peribacteraceae bacterium]